MLGDICVLMTPSELLLNLREEEIPQSDRKVRAIKIASKTQANASVRRRRGCIKFTRYCKLLQNACQRHDSSVSCSAR